MLPKKKLYRWKVILVNVLSKLTMMEKLDRWKVILVNVLSKVSMIQKLNRSKMILKIESPSPLIVQKFHLSNTRSVNIHGTGRIVDGQVGKVISGVYSQHKGKHEDRQFQYYICDLKIKTT